MPDTRTKIKNVLARFGLLPIVSRSLNGARRMKSEAISRRATKEVTRHQGPLSSFVFQSQFSPRAGTSVSGRLSVGEENPANGNYPERRLPFQVDYSVHPAFANYLIWDPRHDQELNALVDTLNEDLLKLESALTLKRLTLSAALNQVREKVHLLIELLVRANHDAGADFSLFANRFEFEILRLAIDDLAYFERRNSYVPVINNAEEMARRNELAVNGFIEFDMTPNELDFLRQRLKHPIETIEESYRQGGRSRDDLVTIEGFDAELRAMMFQIFERRGLNKAVSDVRHELITVGGFSLELSPHDTDWWHSRYEDAGLTKPNSSSYFHNDEGRDIYKAIIYLDDVDKDGGAFCYVPSSFKMERPRFDWIVSRANITTLQAPEIMKTMTDMRPSRGVFSSLVSRRFFGMLPPRLRLNSHFGYDVLDDSEIAQTLMFNQESMVAPAGHVILFDGSRIVHRGGLVKRGKRKALQVSFDNLDRKNVVEPLAALERQFVQESHVY